MAKATDILTDEANELVFKNGDFAILESDEKHIKEVLLGRKGHFRQYPLCGVGISGSVNSPLTSADRIKLEKKVRLQLELDGYVVEGIKVRTGMNILDFDLVSYRK